MRNLAAGAVAAILAAGEAGAVPMTAPGEFFNVPSAAPIVRGSLLLSAAASTFRPRGSSTGSAVTAAAGYGALSDAGVDVRLLFMPRAAPPGSEASRSFPPAVSAAQQNFAGGSLGARYRHAFSDPRAPAVVAGFELASASYLSRNTMVWYWWGEDGAQSDRFSPFAAATRDFRLARGAVPVTATVNVGWGLGRFRGYGPISARLPGFFSGVAVRRGAMSVVAELDGRDFNAGLRYDTGRVRVSLAALQLEHLKGDVQGLRRPVHFAVGGSYLLGAGRVLPPRPEARLLPPARRRVATAGTTATLAWESEDAARSAGVNVYAAKSPEGPWRRVNTSPLTTSSVALRGVRDAAGLFLALSTVGKDGRESARSAPLRADGRPVGAPPRGARPAAKPPAAAPVPRSAATAPAAARPLAAPDSFKVFAFDDRTKFFWKPVAGAAHYDLYDLSAAPPRRLNAEPVRATSFVAEGASGSAGKAFAVAAVSRDGRSGARTTGAAVPAVVPRSAAPPVAPTGAPERPAAAAPAVAAAPPPTKVAPPAATAAPLAPERPPAPPAAERPATARPAGGGRQAPQGLKGRSLGGAVKLTWQADEGAAGYHVYISQESGKGFSRASSRPETKPEWRLEGLPAGVPFFFQVTSLDAGGNESPRSKEVSVVP